MRVWRSLGRDLLAPSLRKVGADRLTARSARDTRSAISALLTGEREHVDTTPTKRYPPLAHNDRFAAASAWEFRYRSADSEDIRKGGDGYAAR
jgi:hypothetical protein